MLDEVVAPLLTTEWGRRASFGVMLVAACLVIYTFICAIVIWHSDFVLTHNQNLKMANENVSDDTAKLIAQVPQLHIFGNFGTLEKDTFLPITSLQLRLVGVSKAIPEKFSRVIISEKGQPGKVYQIGDSLPSGVIIHELVQDGVILENSGRLEKLPLQRTQLQFHGMPKSLLSNDRNQEK
jgi:general secretion pathway protein C